VVAGRLAHRIQRQGRAQVHVLTLSDRRLTEIADDPRGQIMDYTWSPRGNHLAFSMADARGVRAIHVWSAGDGRVRKVTEGFFSEYGPAWDPDGNYLYYLSNREFAPQLSNIEWNFAGNRSTRIYALSLRRDVPHPFPPAATRSPSAASRSQARPADAPATSPPAARRTADAAHRLRRHAERVAAGAAASRTTTRGWRRSKGHLFYAVTAPDTTAGAASASRR
jgi:dipeptidyl aminopeptidase/acylaminoacyl peptidase